MVWLELAPRVQRAAKLRHPVAADRTGLVDTKHPMLVAVERNRFAPGFEIGSRRMEIGKEPAPGLNRGRFTCDKLQVH